MKSNAPNDWMLYKRKRNITNEEKRLTKQAYYENSFNEHTGDSRKTWQTIKELTSRKCGKTSVTSLKINGLTILGPHLFLLYINDLPSFLSHCEPRMYVDDTHLTYADNVGSIELCLSEGLLTVLTNNLTLNMTKTKFMLIGSGQRLNIIAASPSVLMNGTRVKQVATTKSLGITI